MFFTTEFAASLHMLCEPNPQEGKTKLTVHIQSILTSSRSTGLHTDKYIVLGAVDSDSGSAMTA